MDINNSNSDKLDQKSPPPKISFDIFKKFNISYDSIWLTICNLNIFGLGYFLCGKYIRGYVYVAINIISIIIANFTQASNRSLFWACFFFLLFSGCAIDLLIQTRKKPIRKPRFLKKTPFLLPLLSLTINALFYGGFIFYRQTGNSLLQQGRDAFDQSDFHTAYANWYALDKYYQLSLNPDIISIENSLDEASLLISSRNFVDDENYEKAFKCIQTFYSLFHESKNKDLIDNIGLDAYIGWSQDLVDQNAYNESFNVLSKGIIKYTTEAASRNEELDKVFINLFMAWGDFLYKAEDYENAILKYSYITMNYPDSSTYDEAYECSAQTLFDWALAYDEENAYEYSAHTLEEIINNYDDSSVFDDANQQLPNTYMDWGKQLVRSHDYIQALITFEQIHSLTNSNSIVEMADKEHASTIILLANDTGDDGDHVVNQAKILACDGEIPEDPSIDIFSDEPGKVLGCSYRTNRDLDKSIKANKPGTFRFIAEEESDTKTIQTCLYTGGHTLYREQAYTTITIKYVLTGEVYKSKTIYGPPPESCPNEYAFGNRSERSLYGSDVTSEDITEWIFEVLQ